MPRVAQQQERFKGLRKVRCNAGMRTKELHKHCQLKPDAQAQFPPSSFRVGLRRAGKMAITKLNFSVRAY